MIQTPGRGTRSSELCCVALRLLPVLRRPACLPASLGPAPRRVSRPPFRPGSAFSSSFTPTSSHADTLSIWPAASHAWLQRGPVLPGAAVGQEARGSGAGAEVGTAGGLHGRNASALLVVCCGVSAVGLGKAPTLHHQPSCLPACTQVPPRLPLLTLLPAGGAPTHGCLQWCASCRHLLAGPQGSASAAGGCGVAALGLEQCPTHDIPCLPLSSNEGHVTAGGSVCLEALTLSGGLGSWRSDM